MVSQFLNSKFNLASFQPDTPKQNYVIGHRNITVHNLISEGGYAFVYKVTDANTQNQYALKKIYASTPEAQRTVQNEVKVWKQLSGHPNIVSFLDATKVEEKGVPHILILCELCPDGTLFDLLTKYDGKLSEQQVLFIMKDVTQGLVHMHEKGLAHRDIKIENVLLSQKKFKLCDFGSTSGQVLEWGRQPGNVDEMFEEFEKYTTMMYRPPEMIDRYLRYDVTLKADIWMLGCVLYTLCFFQHPFQDAQKLAITNAHYFIPDDTRVTDKMKDFIRLLLVPNPEERPSSKEVLSLLERWPTITSIKLSEKALEIKKKQMEGQRTMQPRGGDLTADDIAKLQEKIRMKDQGLKKSYVKEMTFEFGIEAQQKPAQFDFDFGNSTSQPANTFFDFNMQLPVQTVQTTTATANLLDFDQQPTQQQKDATSQLLDLSMPSSDQQSFFNFS